MTPLTKKLLNNPIQLFIVADKQETSSITKILSNFSNIKIIAKAYSAQEAVSLVSLSKVKPQIIIFSLNPSIDDNLNAICTIKKDFNNIAIVVLTEILDEVVVLKTIQAGATGYVIKGIDSKTMYSWLLTIHNGGAIIEPMLAKRMLNYLKPMRNLFKHHEKPTKVWEKLTPREIEILQLIAKGYSNNEAALYFKLSYATVRTHIENIYQKLDAKNRVDAAVKGIKKGVINL